MDVIPFNVDVRSYPTRIWMMPVVDYQLDIVYKKHSFNETGTKNNVSILL